MRIGKVQRAGPGVRVGMPICDNIEQGKVAQSGVAKIRIDAAAAHRHRQSISHFESPERRNERALLGNPLVRRRIAPVVSSP